LSNFLYFGGLLAGRDTAGFLRAKTGSGFAKMANTKTSKQEISFTSGNRQIRL